MSTKQFLIITICFIVIPIIFLILNRYKFWNKFKKRKGNVIVQDLYQAWDALEDARIKVLNRPLHYQVELLEDIEKAQFQIKDIITLIELEQKKLNTKMEPIGNHYRKDQHRKVILDHIKKTREQEEGPNTQYIPKQ